MIWWPFSPRPGRQVLAHLPVERHLEGVLDRERAALDEEQVVAQGLRHRAREGLDELGQVGGVDVGVGRLVERRRQDPLRELGRRAASGGCSPAGRSRRGVEVEHVAAAGAVEDERAVAAVEVHDQVVAVHQDVLFQGIVHLPTARSVGWRERVVGMGTSKRQSGAADGTGDSAATEPRHRSNWVESGQPRPDPPHPLYSVRLGKAMAHDPVNQNHRSRPHSQPDRPTRPVVSRDRARARDRDAGGGFQPSQAPDPGCLGSAPGRPWSARARCGLLGRLLFLRDGEARRRSGRGGLRARALQRLRGRAGRFWAVRSSTGWTMSTTSPRRATDTSTWFSSSVSSIT